MDFLNIDENTLGGTIKNVTPWFSCTQKNFEKS